MPDPIDLSDGFGNAMLVTDMQGNRADFLNSLSDDDLKGLWFYIVSWGASVDHVNSVRQRVSKRRRS
jgi:hypothetical protein